MKLLDLSRNAIGDRGGIFLGKLSTKVEILLLSECNFTYVTVEILSQNIKKSDKVRLLQF